MRLVAVLGVCLIFLSGCTRTGVTFHVLNAEGQPLEGVLVKEQGGRLYFGGGGSSGHNVYVTDASAVLKTNRIRTDWGYQWIFTKPGYQRTQVSQQADGLVVFSPLLDFDNGHAVPYKPFVAVILHRQKLKEEDKTHNADHEKR